MSPSISVALVFIFSRSIVVRDVMIQRIYHGQSGMSIAGITFRHVLGNPYTQTDTTRAIEG